MLELKLLDINKNLNLLILVLGIILTIFAIWLGLPK